MDGPQVIEISIDYENKFLVLNDIVTVLGMLHSSTRMGSNWQSYIGENWRDLVIAALAPKKVDPHFVLEYCHWNTTSNCIAWRTGHHKIKDLLPQAAIIKIHCPLLHPFVDQINQQCPHVTFWWWEGEA